MDVNQVMDRFQDEDTLNELSIGQSKIFVDLLILTIMIDGEITDTELDALADQWSQLPFAGSDTLEDMIGEHGYETRAKIQGFNGDESKYNALLAKTADQIEEPNREAALRMVAVVSQSDGVAEEEVQLCHALGRHFGFTSDRTAEIIGEIYDHPNEE
jgi:tellurite resistance protein